jgi:hypothetical protein
MYVGVIPTLHLWLLRKQSKRMSTFEDLAITEEAVGALFSHKISISINVK